MHIHGKTTLAMLRAEGVNVAAHTYYSSERPRRLPLEVDQSDATHLTCSNQEIEHWNFGNAFYFNIPTTVLDPAGGARAMTPMFHYDEQVRRMGGITMRWLRARPFAARGNGQQQPEIAADAALGLIDVWNVLDNSMQERLDRPEAVWTGEGWKGVKLYALTYQTWYRLLDCGLRIAPGAGTSYGRLSRLGFNRVYAKVDGPLSVASWAAALKRGDGFVTNGPLLWLRVNDRLPGDGVSLARPGRVSVSVLLASAFPVNTVEILRNGRVAVRMAVEGVPVRERWEHTVEITEPSWLAARCFGRMTPRYPHAACHNQFAHTAPCFVTVEGKKPSSSQAAAGFVREIDALISVVGEIPGADLRQRSLKAFRTARAYYAAMAGE
jgi:hypothetical protein